MSKRDWGQVARALATTRRPIAFFALTTVGFLAVTPYTAGWIQGVCAIGAVLNSVYVMLAVVRWPDRLLAKKAPHPRLPEPPPPPPPLPTAPSEATTLRSDPNAPPQLEARTDEVPAVSDDDGGSLAQDIDRQMRKLATAGSPDWAKDAARLVGQLLNAGRKDHRSLSIVRGWAMQWGWQLSPRVSFDPVYDALSHRDTAVFLLVLVRQDAARVFLRGDRSFSPARELRDKFWPELATDERAEVHLALARRARSDGDLATAEKEMSSASACASSPAVRAQIHTQRRRWAFLGMSTSAIRAALDLDVVDAESMAYQHCRRGADALLLGDTEVARTHYSKALELARDGDERAVALRGQQLTLDWKNDSVEWKKLSREIDAIPTEQRPRIVALDAMRHRAGSCALREDWDHASDELSEYLDEARALGWPHSSQPNNTGALEHAAANLARLYLRECPEESTRLGFEIMLQYGTAREVDELTAQDLIHRTLSTPDALQYLRTAVATEDGSGPPRVESTKRLLRAHMLSVLPDDIIVRSVEQYRQRISDASELDRALEDEWVGIVSNSTCLPEEAMAAAVAIEQVLVSKFEGPRSLRATLSERFWRFWSMFGGPPAEIESALTSTLIEALTAPEGRRRARVDRELFNRIATLAEVGVLSTDAKREILLALKGKADTSEDSHAALFRWIALLAVEPSATDVEGQSVVQLFPEVRHSSDARAWVWVAEVIAGREPALRPAILESAVVLADDLLGESSRMFQLVSPFQIGRLLRTLAKEASPEAAPSIVTKLKELVARDVGCVGLLGGLAGVSSDDLAAVRDGIRRYGDRELRNSAAFALADWAKNGGVIPDDLRHELRHLLHADDPHVRAAGFQVFRDLLEHDSTPEERQYLEACCAQAVLTDAHWLVRANAGHTYADLRANRPPDESDQSVIDALRSDESALCRRIGDLCESKLKRQ